MPKLLTKQNVIQLIKLSWIFDFIVNELVMLVYMQIFVCNLRLMVVNLIGIKNNKLLKISQTPYSLCQKMSQTRYSL